MFCVNIWCKYEKAKISGVKYVDKPGLPIVVNESSNGKGSRQEFLVEDS